MTTDKTPTTKVLPCNCHHEYSDMIYGAGNRLHNRSKVKGMDKFVWRCTVCKREKS